MTLETATNETVRALIDTSSSSSAKARPPMGALKVAATAAAAPAPSRVMRWRTGMATTRPIMEPKAEPICTIGPSRPAEPPLPRVTAVATALAMTTTGRMWPRS